MAFTDQLADADSQLGNMSLGIGTSFNGNVYDKSVSHTLTLTQTLNKGVGKTVAQSLTLSQAVGLSTGELVDSTLTLTQSVALNKTLNLSVSNTLTLSQSVSRVVEFNRSVNHTLTFTQQASIIKNPYYVEASNSLTLAQDVDVTISKPTSNELTLTDEATVVVSYYRSVHQTLTIAQSVDLLTSRAYSAHSYLGLSQSVQKSMAYSRSLVQPIYLTQELWRDRTDEDSPHSLILSHTVVGVRVLPRGTSSSLVLTQSVSVAKTLNFDVSHTLVFKHSHIRPGGFSIPDAFGVVVEQITILQSGASTIVLPRPEFNDSRSNPSRLNIKRAMDGTRRVYKRITISDTLSYRFIIDRRKFRELRTFILAHNSDKIRLQNFKGEVWNVQFTNNPFNFVEEAYWGDQPGGNKCSITLDFEGVKVN